MSDGSWIGVDLDGVLAEWIEQPTDHTTGNDAVLGIGPPIPTMVERVKAWLAEGKRVRIMTARVAACGARSSVATDDRAFAANQRALIAEWCLKVFGQILPVTATKDWQMVAFYDDRCVQMVTNTGESLQEQVATLTQELERLKAYEHLAIKYHDQNAMLTEALEKAQSFNVRKFISDWSWGSSHGPTLFHGEYHEQKQALERFGQALVEAALAAVRGERISMCYPDPCHPGFMIHVMRDDERCACGALPEPPRGSSSSEA
jgi:hypothetical protein